MKRQSHKQAVAAISAQWIAHVTESAKAIRYIYAANKDERDGFPYTAAIEWRCAAELFSLNTHAVEYCWRQWERIMSLPRRLANPIVDETTAQFVPEYLAESARRPPRPVPGPRLIFGQ